MIAASQPPLTCEPCQGPSRQHVVAIVESRATKLHSPGCRQLGSLRKDDSGDRRRAVGAEGAGPGDRFVEAVVDAHTDPRAGAALQKAPGQSHTARARTPE